MVAVATGLWRDHTRSDAFSWTITLPVAHGYVLLSSLALLVTIARTSFWNVTAFFFHAGMARSDVDSPVGLQHRVVLRNSQGSAGAAWEFVKICLAWPKTGSSRLLTRTAQLAIPAVLIWIGFAVATVFTPRIATKSYGSVVARALPGRCGFRSFVADDGFGPVFKTVATDTAQARSYASNFYAGRGPSWSAVQPVFVKPSLPYTTSESAPCPLPAASRCLLGENTAYSMTTGLLDSHEMLGINAPADDRVTLQLSVTCSLLDTRGLVEEVSFKNDTVLAFNIGRVEAVAVSGSVFANRTYVYNTQTAISDATYLVATRMAFAPGMSKEERLYPWEPIADLNRTDADMSVFFLSQNHVGYFTPVLDPWFSANGTRTLDVPGSDSPIFLPDEFISTLVCADQYRMCNPATGACTAQGGQYQLLDAVVTDNAPGFSTTQRATAGRLLEAVSTLYTVGVVAALGPGALWAAADLVLNMSPGLPDGQWRTEALGWFQTNLAQLQAAVVGFAANAGHPGPVDAPRDVTAEYVPDEAAREALERQCGSQLVRTAGEVQNFSFLGVLLVVGLCLFFIFVDWMLEPVADLLWRWTGRGQRARSARLADDKLHLLRLALSGREGESSGVWKLGRLGIPIRDGCAVDGLRAPAADVSLDSLQLGPGVVVDGVSPTRSRQAQIRNGGKWNEGYRLVGQEG